MSAISKPKKDKVFRRIVAEWAKARGGEQDLEREIQEARRISSLILKNMQVDSETLIKPVTL
jgi:hypothetical protein